MVHSLTDKDCLLNDAECMPQIKGWFRSTRRATMHIQFDQKRLFQVWKLLEPGAQELKVT